MASVSRLSIIKFIELLIAVTCMGLHYKSQTRKFEEDSLASVAFGGYIVIIIGGFAGHLMSTPFNRRIDIFFSIVGCALFVAAGALNIQHFDKYSRGDDRDYGLSKGSLGIIGGALFLLDALLTWRGD